MSRIKPYEIYNFGVLKESQRGSNYFKLITPALNILKEQYHLCCKLTEDEFQKIMSIAKYAAIFCDENFNLISFMLASARDINDTVTVYYVCGEDQYIEEHLQYSKRLAGLYGFSEKCTVYVNFSEEDKDELFEKHEFIRISKGCFKYENNKTISLKE